MASSDANGAPRARLSILDRLAEPEPREGADDALPRTATGDELKAIVRRDLEWLLSTRRTVQRDRPAGAERTVTEYGIPDFAPVSPSDQQALNEIARAVRQAIEAYEPRLRNVEVAVEPALQPGQVTARIDAVLRVGEVRRPVTFPLTIRTSG